MGVDEKVTTVRPASPTMSDKPSDEVNIARFGKKQQFKVGSRVSFVT